MAADIAEILKALQLREPIFHRPEFGTTRKAFEDMTEPDFWEVGASGTCYSREFVLDELEKRHASAHEDVWQTRDFRCAEIAENNYLLTYTLVQGERITRRATLWRCHNGYWKVVYHHGTIVT